MSMMVSSLSLQRQCSKRSVLLGSRLEFFMLRCEQERGDGLIMRSGPNFDGRLRAMYLGMALDSRAALWPMVRLSINQQVQAVDPDLRMCTAVPEVGPGSRASLTNAMANVLVLIVRRRGRSRRILNMKSRRIFRALRQHSGANMRNICSGVLQAEATKSV
eukprot:5922033-Pyramimonas_sp.AAC.1